MRTRTFLAFVAPSLVSMGLLIALPLLGVIYLALHQSHVKTEQVRVVTKVPLFAGQSRDQVSFVPQAVLDEHGRPVRVWSYVGLRNMADASQIREVEEAIAKDRPQASLPDLVEGMYRDVTNLDFWGALEFTLLLTFVSTPFVLVLGFLLALAVNRATQWLKGPLIFASLLPMIVTPVVSALAIYWLFLDNAIVASVLRQLGFGQIYFLKDSFTIRTLIIVYEIWYAVPFAFIVLYAGLQSVPQEALEAAYVDGASRWQATRMVTIPHLAPLFAVIALIHIMDAYRVFEPILVFNSRVFASSLQYLIYNVLSFEDNVHRAAAYGVLTVIGIVILLIPVLVRTWRDQKGTT